MTNAKSIDANWSDPVDAPKLTQAWADRADAYRGDTLVRRGRPRVANPKRQISLRLDPDVIDRFRATGPGWQSRINQILRDAAPISQTDHSSPPA